MLMPPLAAVLRRSGPRYQRTQAAGCRCPVNLQVRFTLLPSLTNTALLCRARPPVISLAAFVT